MRKRSSRLRRQLWRRLGGLCESHLDAAFVDATLSEDDREALGRLLMETLLSGSSKLRWECEHLCDFGESPGEEDRPEADSVIELLREFGLVRKRTRDEDLRNAIRRATEAHQALPERQRRFDNEYERVRKEIRRYLTVRGHIWAIALPDVAWQLLPMRVQYWHCPYGWLDYPWP